MKEFLAGCRVVSFVAAIGFLVAALNWKNTSGAFLDGDMEGADPALEILRMTDRSLGYCLLSVGLLMVALGISWYEQWTARSD